MTALGVVAKAARAPGRLLRRAVLACCLAAALPALGEEEARPFVVVAGGEPGTWDSRLSLAIYTEAFRRLNVPFRMEHYTLARGAAMVEQGQADAEVSRVLDYGNDKPYLVRVEESIIDLGFSLYAANPAVRLERLEDLRARDYQVEYRRGLLLCENTLRKFVPAERLTDVATREQGLHKLLAGRTDLYCEIDVYVHQEMESPEFKGSRGGAGWSAWAPPCPPIPT